MVMTITRLLVRPQLTPSGFYIGNVLYFIVGAKSKLGVISQMAGCVCFLLPCGISPNILDPPPTIFVQEPSTVHASCFYVDSYILLCYIFTDLIFKPHKSHLVGPRTRPTGSSLPPQEGVLLQARLWRPSDVLIFVPRCLAYRGKTHIVYSPITNR